MFLDCQSLFRHFLRSLSVERLSDGTIPPYIPSESSVYSGGLGLFQRITASSPGWGDAAVFMPFQPGPLHSGEAVGKGEDAARFVKLADAARTA